MAKKRSVSKTQKQETQVDLCEAARVVKPDEFLLSQICKLKALTPIKTHHRTIDEGELLAVTRDKNLYYIATDGEHIWREKFIRRNLVNGSFRAVCYG